MNLPAYLEPPLSLYLDTLVFRAVLAYDLERRNDNLARQVMACFDTHNEVSAEYLESLMPQIFDVIEEQMEIMEPNWGHKFTQDEAETIMHYGLIFTAEFLLRYVSLPLSAPINPVDLYSRTGKIDPPV